jgi:hypothetical protein
LENILDIVITALIKEKRKVLKKEIFLKNN